MKIVIIEDELYSSNDLIRCLQSTKENIEIIAHLTTVEESIKYFQNNIEVDLIFSDIMLGDGLSFDIFKKMNLNIPTIFCTAYDEYALQAFESNGIDYILKPFNPEKVKNALDKFINIVSKQALDINKIWEAMEQLKQQIIPNKLPNIIIHIAERIIPISGDSIALFYIENTLTKAHTFEQQIHNINYNLDTLEKKYSPTFFRINRQFLVHKNAIKEASQHFNRKLLVHLNIEFKEQIFIAKEKAPIFLQWLAE